MSINQQIYEAHHLNKHSILARVMREKGSLHGISELDLASDDKQQITDQNHVGGFQFVKQLAKRAYISSNSKVVDLCSGLGGPARYLSYTLGCRVLGIELNKQRCTEARELSEIVELSHLTSFECGDVLTIELPKAQFDVIWGQNSWIHITNKADLIRRWLTMLKKGGRIAMEDVYLKDGPALKKDKLLLKRLEQIWNSRIVSLEVWENNFIKNGLEIEPIEELSDEFVIWFSNLHRHSKAENSLVSTYELKGWELAMDLANKNIIGYFRLVAINI